MASKGRAEPWRSSERHYCSVCNAWMGSDKQSIMIHENGKKHRENLEESLRRRRDDKKREEKERDDLSSSMKEMERVASIAHAKDLASGSFASGGVSPEAFSAAASFAPRIPGAVGSAPSTVPARSSAVPDANKVLPKRKGAKIKERDAVLAAKSTEMDSWHERKRRREETRDRLPGRDAGDRPSDDGTGDKSNKRKLGENEGHYTVDGTTYLEGSVYASIFDEDVPAQIWVGSTSATEMEKRAPENGGRWKTGLIVKVRRLASTKGQSFKDANESISFDFAYLNDPTNKDEILEESVVPNRTRLAIGSDEEGVPGTIEEARLSLLGGEEIISVGGDDLRPPEVDENTGLTSWGTVSVRKVTVRQEIQEERARLRAKRRQEAEVEQKAQRDREERRMEEAKHAHADDSALGAFDVSSSGKGGYKGVDIDSEAKLGVLDTAKSLSKGKGVVGFKKRSGGSSSSLFKKAKKKQNRRTTSADDD